MNLHTLPPWKSLYTLYVTYDEVSMDANYEEVDIVTKRIATPQEVVEAAREILNSDYPDAKVVAVIDQSQAYVMYNGVPEMQFLKPSKEKSE